MSKHSNRELPCLKLEEMNMAKYRLYRKDNTFEEVNVGGTYVFFEKRHQVYFPNIRAKIKNVYKVEVVENAESEKKNIESKKDEC